MLCQMGITNKTRSFYDFIRVIRFINKCLEVRMLAKITLFDYYTKSNYDFYKRGDSEIYGNKVFQKRLSWHKNILDVGLEAHR